MSFNPIPFVFVILIMIFHSCGAEEDATENLFSNLPEYQMETVEVLGDQGDLILGRPVHTEIDSEGNRLVMDLSVFQVHVYDRDGVYQNSFGTEGDGPGEFRQPGRPIISENDTLYFSDYRRQSLLVYKKTGNYEWEHAYDLAFPQTEGGAPTVAMAPSETGYPVVYRMHDNSDEFPDGYSTVKLVDSAGRIISDTDVAFRSGKMITIETNGNRIMLGLAEVHNSQIAPHPNGTYYQAWTADPVIYQYSARGELLKTIQLEGYPILPVTNQAISSMSEQRFGGQFGNIANDLREAVGENFPAFSEIMVMKDDSIWLREIVPESNNESWYHLTPEGKPLGRLSLEPGEDLRNAVGNDIYVSGTDEDGSPVIIRYRIDGSVQNLN